jgi:NAD(P)-dependent dehydrogenase (short-subunit alcohol dehydrogenase family)
MKDFAGRIAAITGGGSGMGRELARQLVVEGCNVAICDVSTEAMDETKRLCEVQNPAQVRVTTHLADVSIEDHYKRFRGQLIERHSTDKIHLLFNNAGIGGGGSIVTDPREEWERTFNICWGGVYLGVRTFLPLLIKADEARIINTSSISGFWAAIRPSQPHTAYSAAKFAVKGFTEALINDLRLNAPHVKCAVVMPGHVGTAVNANTRKVLSGADCDQLSADELTKMRLTLTRTGVDHDAMSDRDIQRMIDDQDRAFQDNAPLTAAAAAKIIIDGVKSDQWRILVGHHAHIIDELVRRAPEQAYTQEFYDDWIATRAMIPK